MKLSAETNDTSSTEYLEHELKATQKSLDRTLRWQQQKEEEEGAGNATGASKQPKIVQLARLSQTADSLVLAQAVADWIGQAPPSTGSDNSDLIANAEWCHRLAVILLEHPNTLELGGATIYEETYLPLYSYVYPSLLALFRSELQARDYPKNPQQAATLIQQCRRSPETCAWAQACVWILRLQPAHQEVVEIVEGRSLPENPPALAIVRALLRPIVQRVRFHFLEPSEDRATSTRIDRLPEWLLGYIQENVLECKEDDGASPLDLIQHGLTGILPMEDAANVGFYFWNELVRLVQGVLLERQFFHHPEIAGPNSSPLLLYNGVEQFLLFDRGLRESAPVITTDNEDARDNSDNGHVLGLMDVLIMANEDLRQWWIDRERESVFSTLFEDDSMRDVPKPLANHVSPRAELFCALIRSVQWKASTLTGSPGVYLRHVAVPLCSQFVDALHETSTELRNLMCQPVRGGMSSQHLVSNLHEWMELINGTHLAASVLLREGAWHDGMPATSQSDHDLARFGRSLERLVDVLVEECSASFVETILMEQAKLASYLMTASHLLASPEWDGDDQDLSSELKDTRDVLAEFHRVCHSILSVTSNDDETGKEGESSPDTKIAHFAPTAMRRHVIHRVADKFLETALDIHNMTPDLWQGGAQIFARDTQMIFGGCTEFLLVQRLLDVTTLLTTSSSSTEGLLAALGGLVGATDFLDIYDFSSYGTIYDEAVFMLKAKGFTHLELEDAVSILNRRRD